MQFLRSNKTLISIGIATLTACVVEFFWAYGRAIAAVFIDLTTHHDSAYSLWKLLPVAAAAYLTSYLAEKYPLKRLFPHLLIFAAVWFLAGIFAAKYLATDLAVLPVIFVLCLTTAFIHFKKLWLIDRELTEKLVTLASAGHLLEGKSADLRIEAGFKLLETIFPVSEIIVFRHDAQKNLVPIGRARKNNQEVGLMNRQNSWVKCVELCEQAIAEREAQIRKDETNMDAAKAALPLICDGVVIGVLFVDIKQNFELEDRFLLEAFSRQLARSFQRRELRRKKLPHNAWWNSFSTQSLENRLDIINLIHGIIREQSFSAFAGSHLHEAHAIAYLDGTLAYLNRPMKQMSGIAPAEIPDLDLFKLLDKFKTEVFNEPGLAIRRVMQTGETFECELRYPDSDETFGLQITLVKAPAESADIHETSARKMPACFLVTFRNISALKENEKLRSDMAHLMSHELRTPITSIQGFAEILLLEENLGEDTREYLQTIAAESQRAGKILSNFLSVANLEQADKQEVIKTPVEVNNVVLEVVEDLSRKAKEKRIRLVDRRSKNLPPIAADKGLIQQAIAHLVDNAIRYSPERSSVMISTMIDADFLRVEVEDRGYGIPKSEQEKIWQKFYRVAREGQDKQEDTTGLGLSLVKEIVEQHQGEVSVLSVEGRGSRFGFRLPRL